MRTQKNIAGIEANYLYIKYGFIEMLLKQNSPYKRENIKMELKV